MQWLHPVGGEYNGFNHRLQAVALRIWRPLEYRVNPDSRLAWGDASPRITPETASELAENLAFVSQRALPEPVRETRLCQISTDGQFVKLPETASREPA